MKQKLFAKTLKITSLSKSQINEMFTLFEIFYENVSYERFLHDLQAKTRVIIMVDKNKRIQGFSTLHDFDFLHNKKKYRILFSGDTIITPDFWGTSALTVEFVKNMIFLKMKYPTRPVWWFLISKGYKTYLLLANNFLNYYPRYDKKTPTEYQSLIQALSDKLYPNKYNRKTGIIEFDMNEHERLRASIAPITKDLMEKYPRIKFFQTKNPNWINGHELACIGEVNPFLGISHPIKLARKFFKKKK